MHYLTISQMMELIYCFFCYSGRTVDVKLDQSHLLITGSREDVKKAQDFYHSSFLPKLGYEKLEVSETGLDQRNVPVVY